MLKSLRRLCRDLPHSCPLLTGHTVTDARAPATTINVKRYVARARRRVAGVVRLTKTNCVPTDDELAVLSDDVIVDVMTQ